MKSWKGNKKRSVFEHVLYKKQQEQGNEDKKPNKYLKCFCIFPGDDGSGCTGNNSKRKAYRMQERVDYKRGKPAD
jgi:hypothetical protein